MSDDLGRRLEAATQRAPEGTPDLRPVIAHGKRTRIVRYAGTAIGMVAIASVATFAAMNIDLGGTDEPRPVRPVTHEDGVFVPAEPGEPTYLLSGFDIRYPYARIDDMPRVDGDPNLRDRFCSARPDDCKSEGQAAFLYEYDWSTDEYPGAVDCKVVLYAKTGDQVAEEIWGLTALEPHSRGPSLLVVQVTGEPHSAEASCEAGTFDPNPAYRFTYAGSEPYDPGQGLPERLRLTFDVEQLNDNEHPGTDTCALSITFEDGEVVSGSFTRSGSVEDPWEFETGHPASRPIEDATLVCNPMR